MTFSSLTPSNYANAYVILPADCIILHLWLKIKLYQWLKKICLRTYCASVGKPVLCEVIRHPMTMPVVVRPWPTWQLNNMAGRGAEEFLSNNWGMSLMAVMNWSKSCSSGAFVAVIGIREYLHDVKRLVRFLIWREKTNNFIAFIESTMYRWACAKHKTFDRQAWTDKDGRTRDNEDKTTNPDVQKTPLSVLWTGAEMCGWSKLKTLCSR